MCYQMEHSRFLQNWKWAEALPTSILPYYTYSETDLQPEGLEVYKFLQYVGSLLLLVA